MTKKPRSKTASNADDGLIGMFGHTLNEEGDIVWQFKIVRRATTSIFANSIRGWTAGQQTALRSPGKQFSARRSNFTRPTI
jgi:hypothetical protein